MELDDVKMKMLLDTKLTWYCAVLFGLEVRLGESPYKTAHTNGLEIVVDPDFWSGMSEREQIGLLMHELRHVTDLHGSRRMGREPMLWNIAADHVINLDIIAEGFTLPMLDKACCDPKYKDMAVEEVYELLLEDDPEQQCAMPDISDDAGDDSTGTGDSIETQVKDLVIQATQQAEMIERKTGAGHIPGHIKRMVNEWLNPVLPWDTVLRRYMSAKAKEDYSWARPSRRYLSQKLYVPSLYSEAMGPINIYIDASGSVSDEMFAMQVSQMKWIHHNLRPSEMKIIVFNTRITEEYLFLPHEKLSIEFTGYGGTNVSEIVKHMESNPAECHLVFTDGYFNLVPLDQVSGNVLCCIYDNADFAWDKSEVIYLPKV